MPRCVGNANYSSPPGENSRHCTQVIQTARANPCDKFQLGIRRFIEEMMVQRMAENDQIVTRNMDDQAFQDAAFPVLAKPIFDRIRGEASPAPRGRSLGLGRAFRTGAS